ACLRLYPSRHVCSAIHSFRSGWPMASLADSATESDSTSFGNRRLPHESICNLGHGTSVGDDILDDSPLSTSERSFIPAWNTVRLVTVAKDCSINLHVDGRKCPESVSVREVR